MSALRAARASTRRAVVLVVALALGATPSHAQRREPETWEPARDARFWITSAALLAAAVPLDRRLRDAAMTHRSRAADRVAADVDPSGRAAAILPALAAAIVAPRLFGRRDLSDAATRVTLDYLAADAVESALKPAVGRHRPTDGGSAGRFRPFSANGDWHSFPSAHVSHAFALAAGIAGETRRPWVAGGAYAVATLVGAQRVYRDAHWTSDVVASAALAVATSSATDAALRRHGLRRIVRGAHLAATRDGVRIEWTSRARRDAGDR